MKWKSDNAKFFDSAWQRVFAWTPKRCTDGFTRWLCPVARGVRFVNQGAFFIYRPIFKGNHHGE